MRKALCGFTTKHCSSSCLYFLTSSIHCKEDAIPEFMFASGDYVLFYKNYQN